MSRRIAVKDSEGNDDYVVAECGPVRHSKLSGKSSDLPGVMSFYLSTGEALNLESAQRFVNPMTEESYYAVNDEDIEWLRGL
ncbi:hypothetical protein GPM19_00270 [Halomonas sp. ZH2S]|uniref:Uncharacterized protein n=1 Tax=Vreelandella zhuhanensis TaxID=2684210 RepID=A0A7X3KNP8_9GAMM|nr:hypothetical protein [Halomonas zhuhanensis]MWJ26654.1 hypothetical protein [Halomonas zhuhanensis]